MTTRLRPERVEEDWPAVRPSATELVRVRRARAAELRLRHGMGSRRRADGAMRAIDLTLTLAVVPIAVPLIALAALAIAIDSRGPIFFSQLRTGRDGRRFRIWKLRTMVRDAERLKQGLAAQTMAAGAAFKLADDPRITRVGRVLRRLNLDELPQLWNVLRGDMGIVGPRPTSAPPEQYDLWQTARLATRPGLTGAWQVIPRKNEMPFDDRVRVDIRYLRTRTVPENIRLIVRTATHAVGRGQGM